MALIIQNIKNPVTLNNSDGYNEKQTSVINSTIVSIRNQWDRKTRQTVKSQSLGNGIELQGGFINAPKSYKYDHFITCNFYINSSALGIGEKYILFQTYDNIHSFCLQGNNTNPYTEDGDIGNFFLFSFEDNKIYIEKFSDTDQVFVCDINIGVD